jgi:hypothetical protein
MRNHNVSMLLGLLAAAVSCFSQQEPAQVTQPVNGNGPGQLVGSWRLVSRIVRLEDGTLVNDSGLGPTPRGFLIYDSSGHMAVQLMKVDRPALIDCAGSRPSAADNSQSVNGYDAYWGMYAIDQASNTVTHHLEGALAAGDAGKHLVREFQVTGDKLTLIVRTATGNQKQVRTLVWERVR